MIGYYNYTVILTYIGTFSGFLGITYIWSDNLKMSLVCLMIAGFCDMFDGKIASTMQRTKQEKKFGIQIDSLSDLICFGALPALIVFQNTSGKFLHILVCVAYLLCALIRLAWFNVDEEELQERSDVGRKTYLGLPVTSAALLLPLFMEICRYFNWPLQMSVWALVCIAIAFLLPFKLKKPKLVGKTVMMLSGTAIFTILMIGVNL